MSQIIRPEDMKSGKPNTLRIYNTIYNKLKPVDRQCMVTMSLSPEQITVFREEGILVVENVLSQEEVDAARDALHGDILRRTGIQHGGEHWGELGARLKGPGMYMCYARWKLLHVHLKPAVTSAYEQLLEHTYGPGYEPNFEHPFGPCFNHLCMVDRVCYRLPDTVSVEEGLALHLDRNPKDPYLLKAGGLDRWRPIQAFVALTDHFDSNSGGLKVVRGFHKEINEYFEGSAEAEAACGQKGEFFRMNGKSHSKLRRQQEAVYAPRGSLVLWDSRLPHATCDSLQGFDSREVVYTGFLPNTEINRRYISNQRTDIEKNIYPTYGPRGVCAADRDWEVDELTHEQRMRLGFS